MYARGGCRVEAAQQPVERAGASGLTMVETGAQGFIAGGAGGKSVNQSAKVKAGASGDDGDVIAGCDVAQDGASGGGEIAGSEDIRRFCHVYEVVRDSPAFGKREFGGSNIEMAINLNRVTVDDFAAKAFGNMKGEFGLS